MAFEMGIDLANEPILSQDALLMCIGYAGSRGRRDSDLGNIVGVLCRWPQFILIFCPMEFILVAICGL